MDFEEMHRLKIFGIGMPPAEKKEPDEGWAYCNVCRTGMYMPGKKNEIVKGITVTVDAYICNACSATLYPIESIVKMEKIRNGEI